MTTEQIIQELERYRSEFTGIMGRFVHRRNSLDIKTEDDPRYRTFVIEIIDLLNDSIGKNQYSPLINQIFNEGISGYLQSPSYKSIEDIVSVIDSVITRLKRNPDFYIKKEKTENTKESAKPELKPPDKVTLKWLWEYVPHSFWLLLGTLLIGAFGFGVKFAETSLYKSLTNQANIPTLNPIQSNRSSVVSRVANVPKKITTNKNVENKADMTLRESLYKDLDLYNKNFADIDFSLECQNKPEYMERYRQAQTLFNTIEAKARKTGDKEILETFVWPKRQGIHRASNSCP